MTVDHQQHLTLSRRANRVAVTAEMLEAQKSLLAAINLCVTLSGLSDQEVAAELEIQPAQFSRIKTGESHFPPNKLGPLMDLCGNEAPLLWLAHSRGKGVHLLKSEAERQRDDALAQLTLEQVKVQALMEAMRGGR